MTDTELNEAVARKLGWKNGGVIGELDGMAVGFHYIKPDGMGSSSIWPSYSTSIEAVWEIVEMLPDVAIYKWPEGGFAVSIPQRDAEGNLSNAKGVQANAATAPRAICEAFLKLP